MLAMEQPDTFSPSYAAARDRFLQAAKALGAPLSSFPVEAQGPNGEELSIEVACLGAREPARAVVVSSGLHGIEGFFGSAIQTAWLESFARSGGQLPPATAVVLIHGLNPFGFAWRRRVNETNVDLNRNFLLPSDSYTGVPPEVRELRYFLNPGTPPPRFSLFLPQAVWLILRYGMRKLKAALTQGQYEFEDGLFFGGKRPEEGTALVQARFDSWVTGSPRVLHLDFHSGLGRFKECRLLSVEPAGSPRSLWLAERFGPERVEAIGAGVAARTTARGNMGNWLTATLNGLGRNYAFLTPEFGTYSGIRVFEALRDENRVHRHPGHRAYERIKARLVEVFCPASTVWRKAVVNKGLELIGQAIEVCQDEKWEASVMP
jgi:hypothetical protein